jgi:hypothetical protein
MLFVVREKKLRGKGKWEFGIWDLEKRRLENFND